ncbi:MAG: 4-hydroxy-tetrahydrodipicolinate reductase [Thermodesulfobacteriota bacterium]
MTRVIVTGAAGQMGKRNIAMTCQAEGMTLAAAVERPDHPALGQDAGEVAGCGRLGVPITGSLAAVLDQGDVVIDFTFHTATMEHARLAARAGRAMVIGTTGLSATDLVELQELSSGFACVQSPNMAVGVNVLFKIAARMAGILGSGYDIEIVEAHHRRKKDAPSGTALKLGEVVAQALGRDLGEVGVFARHGMIGQRTDQEIGIQTVRAGDIVGEHTVLFAGPGERLELIHRAHSRDNFARGAVLAAAWVNDRPHGLYTMFDVLGLADL